MLKEKMTKIWAGLSAVGASVLALGTQFVIADDALGGVSTAANDTAASLVANLGKILPVLVPVLVVAFIIGLVIGVIRKR